MTESVKILVCGSSTMPRKFAPFAASLGRAIVKDTKCLLMTGGLKQKKKGRRTALDFTVAKAACKAANSRQVSTRKRILTVVPQNDCHIRFHCGKVSTLQQADLYDRRISMALQCNAVISMGGSRATGEMIEIAWQKGRPILPLPFTNGASRAAWIKHRPEIIKRLSITEDEARQIENMKLSDPAGARICVKIINRAIRPSCFVAMQYRNPPIKDLYNTIKRVASEMGFAPFRLDETKSGRQLSDAISEAIQSARLIIADLSRPNLNVYYEVGMSHAIKKEPLLLAYSKNQSLPDDIPSDLRHRITLLYNDKATLIDRLRSELKNFWR